MRESLQKKNGQQETNLQKYSYSGAAHRSVAQQRLLESQRKEEREQGDMEDEGWDMSKSSKTGAKYVGWVE